MGTMTKIPNVLSLEPRDQRPSLPSTIAMKYEAPVSLLLLYLLCVLSLRNPSLVIASRQKVRKLHLQGAPEDHDCVACSSSVVAHIAVGIVQGHLGCTHITSVVRKTYP